MVRGGKFEIWKEKKQREKTYNEHYAVEMHSIGELNSLVEHK